MHDLNATGLKRAALITDLSCLGKCSLSVGLPILSAYGAEAVALPTAVLSTHTDGFGEYTLRDMTEDMKAIIMQWKRLKLRFDCIYTGFFASLEQLSVAEEFIHDFGGEGCLVIVDPILGDNGALYSCFSPAHVDAMRRLCRAADIITPNRTEAQLLTGLGEGCGADALLSALETPNAIVTGVRRGDEIGYAARLDGGYHELFRPYLNAVLHGTGDVFTSALCGELLRGAPLPAAFVAAADFCDRCIAATAPRLASHWYGLAFEEVLASRGK